MELKETIEMMISPDYKERFKAEYFQLLIRYQGLCKMLTNWEQGCLKFTPTCPIEIYSFQKEAMRKYLDTLVIRAKIEGIDITMGEC